MLFRLCAFVWLLACGGVAWRCGLVMSMYGRTDFKRLMELASKTGNYIPAVNEAQKWLDATDFRTRSSLMEITSCIKVFDRAGLVDDAARVIDVVQAKGGTVNTIHFNAAITALKHHKRYEKAVAMFERMQKETACPLDHFTITAVIAVFGEIHAWDRAYDLFCQADQPDAVMQTAILQCAAKCGQPDELVRLFHGFKPPRSHAMFHSVLAGQGAAGRWQEAVETYRTMLREVGADDIGRFNIVRILRQHGQTELADEFQTATEGSGGVGSGGQKLAPRQRAEGLDGGREKGQPSSPRAPQVPLNDLLREARRSGDYSIAVDAADAWRRAQRSSLSSSGGLQVVLQIYGEARLGDRVEEMMQAMDDAALQSKNQDYRPPSLRNYNALLVALVKCGRPKVALSVFERMRDTDSYSFGAALLALERMGNWQAALELFESLGSGSGSGSSQRVEKSVPLYNTLLSSLAKAGQWQKMVAVFREMGDKADQVSKSVVIQGLGRAGQVELLASMRAELMGDLKGGGGARIASSKDASDQATGGDDDVDDESRGGAGKVSVLRSMPVESKAGTLLQKLTEKPAQGGIQSIAKFYAMAGHIENAISMLDQIEEQGQTASNANARMATYNEILVALDWRGDWERAFELFLRMVKNNVPRNKTTYRAIGHVIGEFGDEDCLAHVQRRAENDGVDLNALLKDL